MSSSYVERRVRLLRDKALRLAQEANDVISSMMPSDVKYEDAARHVADASLQMYYVCADALGEYRDVNF